MKASGQLQLVSRGCHLCLVPLHFSASSKSVSVPHFCNMGASRQLQRVWRSHASTQQSTADMGIVFVSSGVEETPLFLFLSCLVLIVELYVP